VAARHVPAGARVLDVGANEGEFLVYLGDRIGPSVGVESGLDADRSVGHHSLLTGRFPERQPDQRFDAAALLAVVEHLDPTRLAEVGSALSRLVRPGGLVVITVPAPAVDTILAVLTRLHLVDGMDVEAHHRFDVDTLPEQWERLGLSTIHRSRFQLGLNNLLVFEVHPLRT